MQGASGNCVLSLLRKKQSRGCVLQNVCQNADLTESDATVPRNRGSEGEYVSPTKPHGQEVSRHSSAPLRTAALDRA